MGIYWKNIDPQLQILGPQQQFNFGQNLNQLQFNTSFVPTLTIPSQNLFEFANASLSGFRFRHVTESGDTFGTLKIQSFVSGQTTGTDLMTFNADGTITLDAGLILDDLNFTKLGIGISPSTDGRIEFANTSLDTKIRFFTNDTPGNPFDQSGMGYLNTAGTLYHCPIGQSHLFFAGANGNLPVEINASGMIVSGSGYSPTDFRKIVFFQKYQTTNPHQSYGYGVLLTGGSAPDLNFDLRAQVGSSAGAFSWCSGTSDTTSTELMRLSFLTGLDLKNNKIVNLLDPTAPQDAATKAYADSVAGQLSNPYALGNNLTFNWSYAAPSNPSSYSFIHNFTDSQQDKTYVNSVLTSGRGWRTNYTLIGNSDLSGTYQISYALTSGSPFVPFKIDVFPFAYTNITLQATNIYVQATMDMGGYEIKNALNPTTAQSLTTKNYVDTAIGALNLTLTGSVTGSSSVSGTLATSFSNNQTVIGGDTQTFTFDPSFASAYFNMFNSNASATSQWRVGRNTNTYLAGGYAASGGYAFINAQNINSLQFLVGGLPQATLTGTGLGIGTTTPTAAKLQIVGGVQNITGEDTAIRISSALSSLKIELNNTAAGGHLYEIRSSSLGDFDITDRTASATRFTIASLGNIGINMGTGKPNSLLQFPNTFNLRVITLNEGANNVFQYTGFGSSAAGLWYSVSNTSLDHIFVAGTSASTTTEVGRITGTGDFVSSGTLYGRRASGMVYMEGNATATTLTANVWTKLGGATIASGSLNKFTSPVSNRLTYTGSNQVIALIDVSATLNFSAGGGATTRSIAIFKNGTQITPSLMSEDSASGININLSTQAFVSLVTNDYIEVYCRSSVTSNVTPVNLLLISTAT